MEFVFIAPIEVSTEALKILEQAMVDGAEYYMKVVPMKAEGAIGYNWRKEAGFCTECNTAPDKPDSFEDPNFEDYWSRKNFSEVIARPVVSPQKGDKTDWKLMCNRCYIGYLERFS